MEDLRNVKAQQAEALQSEAAWDGHVLACCGEPSSSRGWGICCLTLWMPCITHGLNLAYLYTARKVALGVLLFAALCYVLPCIVLPAVFVSVFRTPDIVACEVNVINLQADPDFHQKLFDCQKPGWVKIGVCVAFVWVCALGLLLYLAIVRMRARQRLAITRLCCLKDLCIMLWCTTCALCQENRTLHKLSDPTTSQYPPPTTPPLLPKMDV